MRGSGVPRAARGALVLAALVASAAIGELVAAKPASRGVAVQLRKMGGGPAKKTARGLRLVDGSTGEVLLAARVAAAGKATLRPGAGSVAFAVASVARPSGTREGVSAIFRYEPGARAVKVKVPLEPAASVTAAVATSGVPRLVAPIRTLVAPRGSPVATLGDVTMSGADGGGSISGPLFTPLFDQTSDTIIWVETGDTFTRARQGELDVQNQGRTDPATHIDDNPIPPDLVVDGTLQYDGNHVTGELRIVDPKTGEVIARIPVDVEEGNWSKLMDQLARELARRLRERAATTSTTTSTTATITAPASSTTTGTRPRGTSTTLPAGGTCTSVIPASHCECVGLGGVCTSDTDCQRRGGTTCVDHVGHTLVTYRLAGDGGLLGAIKIDGTEYGLWGPSPTAVLVRGGCGTNAFLQGAVPPLRPEETVCPAYYHPGAQIALQAWKSTSALTAPPGGGIYCDVEFSGWSGGVACTGKGDCDDQVCRCSTSTGTGPFEVVATYTAKKDGTCVPPAAP